MSEPEEPTDLDHRLREVQERYLREVDGREWDWAEVIREIREERSKQQMEALFPHGIRGADQSEQEHTMSSRETTMSTRDLEGHVESIVQRVGDGEAIVVERDGEPKVAIISIEEYRRLKGRQAPTIDDTEEDEPEWYRMVRESGRLIERDLKGKRIDVDKLIHRMREERDEELLEGLR